MVTSSERSPVNPGAWNTSEAATILSVSAAAAAMIRNGRSRLSGFAFFLREFSVRCLFLR